MKRTLTDGSEVEVYGHNHPKYGIPELILCGTNCPFLRKPDEEETQFRCLLGGESFHFPFDAIQSIYPQIDKVPYRALPCLELDPTPDEIDSLWKYAVADMYRDRRIAAC